jgi:hypothetical protein
MGTSMIPQGAPYDDGAPFPGEPTAVTHVPSAPPALLNVSAGVVSADGETASAAAAATAKAMVEARYIVAQHRPRNWMTVMSRLIESCKRPSFAAKCEYALPRWDARLGKEVSITGPSIRFAEEALRAAGNVDIRADVMLDDAEKRIVFISVLDLESNTNYGRAIVVKKTQERAKLKKGQSAIAQRVNSTGQVVYVVEATEDELLMKQNAAISRVIRSDGLRLIPYDIREDAIMVARATREKENATDPGAVAKRLAYQFYQLGVETEALERYLGKKLTAVSSKELESLRLTMQGISDGEVTWDEVMAAKRGDGAEVPEPTAKGNDGLKERLRNRSAATTTTEGTD